MNDASTLDNQISKASLWSAVILILAGVLTRSVAQADIGPYPESIGALLLVAVISMAIYFRKLVASGAGQ